MAFTEVIYVNALRELDTEQLIVTSERQVSRLPRGEEPSLNRHTKRKDDKGENLNRSKCVNGSLT